MESCGINCNTGMSCRGFRQNECILSPVSGFTQPECYTSAGSNCAHCVPGTSASPRAIMLEQRRFYRDLFAVALLALAAFLALSLVSYDIADAVATPVAP